MELTGILKVKMDKQIVSEKFSKREFVLTTDATSQYPQHVSMQLTNDKCELLDGVPEGTELKVQINIKGREWNGPQGIKYFNTLEAWRIEGVSQFPNKPTPNVQAENHAYVTQSPLGQVSDNDDLPF